jgi:hypothetical protein
MVHPFKGMATWTITAFRIIGHSEQAKVIVYQGLQVMECLCQFSIQPSDVPEGFNQFL